MSHFNILYTHQKTKKAKVWQDGLLSVQDSSKRVIYDEKRSKIDTLYTTQQVKVGDEYETDKYMIIVDSVVDQLSSSVTSGQLETTTSLPKQQPAIRNKLASSKCRKGFNPPKRMVITETKVVEPSQVHQVVESAEPVSFFSTYAQLPNYKRRESPPPAVSCTADSTDKRSVRDILSLITSRKFDETGQPLESSDRNEESSLSCQPSHVAAHTPNHDAEYYNSQSITVDKENTISPQNGGSLWSNFLSQERKAQVTVQPDCSPEKLNLKNGHKDSSAANMYRIVNYLHDSLTSEAVSAGPCKLRTSMSTELYVDSESVKCRDNPTDFKTFKHKINGNRLQPLAENSALHNQSCKGSDGYGVHVEGPYRWANQSLGNIEDDNRSDKLALEGPAFFNDNTCRQKEVNNQSSNDIKNVSQRARIISKTATDTYVSSSPELSPKTADEESPQVASFSLGSLPIATDDDMSQSSTMAEDSEDSKIHVNMPTSTPLNDRISSSLGSLQPQIAHSSRTPLTYPLAQTQLVVDQSNGKPHLMCGKESNREVSHHTLSKDVNNQKDDTSLSNLTYMSNYRPKEVISTPPSLLSTPPYGEISVCVPLRSNNLRDILRENDSEEINNASLFDLDESLKPTSMKRRAANDDSTSPRPNNVWSMFNSPKKNKTETRTRSIFELPSPEIQQQQLLSKECHVLPSTELSTHCSTKLLPPSQKSVFGAKLPPEKIEQARNKVQQASHKASSVCSSFAGPSSSGKTNIGAEQVTKLVVDCWTLRFPAYTSDLAKPIRNMIMPISCKTTTDYKQNLEQLLREYINIILLDLCRRYHDAMDAVDITDGSLSSSFKSTSSTLSNGTASGNPRCQHGTFSKMVEVKKEGANKGRMFYTCSNSRGEQCKFFEWVDQKKGTPKDSTTTDVTLLKLSSVQAIEAYLKGKAISFYCNTQLNKMSDSFLAKRWSAVNDIAKNQSLYLKLPRREKASAYTKGDVWVVSQTLKFDLKGHTFIAKSAFYGPNSDCELELTPLAGYSSCNWPAGTQCYAIHVPNVSTELVCLANLQDLNARTVPILPWLIHSSGPERTGGRFEVPTANNPKSNLVLPEHLVVLLSLLRPGCIKLRIARDMIHEYRLNEGQVQSLMAVANMFLSISSKPICLIKGVFGAGKSYLLSIIIQFIVKLLDIIDDNDSSTPDGCAHSKVLISSMTNVAVDRVLVGLLDLDFTDFLRVGSMKKIAKSVLPHSLHASGNTNTELRELQDMLKDEELTSAEKMNIKRAMAVQKSGINKKKLASTRVVGVTCAACSFPVLDNLTFKVVLLDECSQMTEPLSLLPIKRASCSRLVLVGDPRQLKPTIQCSESSHTRGLEQTMFDRLSKMGVPTCQLTTQYRCHPAISAICRDLFYDGILEDGVAASQRPALCRDLPSVCLYNIQGTQRFSDASSFDNEQEARFVCELLLWLVANDVQAEQIGIITLYKAQVYKIYGMMTQKQGLRKVQVATVDSFQGGERDIIILSCVRTDQMGFADDTRRTNVALSRGKHHLIIVGHLENLRRNTVWSHVVSYLEDRTDGILDGRQQTKKWQMAKAELSANSTNASKRKPVANKNTHITCKNARLDRNVLNDTGSTSLDRNVLNDTGCTRLDRNVLNDTGCTSLDRNVLNDTGCTSLDRSIDVKTKTSKSEESILLDSCNNSQHISLEDDDFLTQYQQI